LEKAMGLSMNTVCSFYFLLDRISLIWSKKWWIYFKPQRYGINFFSQVSAFLFFVSLYTKVANWVNLEEISWIIIVFTIRHW